MLKITCTAFFLLISVSIVSAEDFIDKISNGNKAFSEKKYTEAFDFYKSAEKDLPNSSELEYNLAGALYQKNDFEQAIEKYQQALNTNDLNLEAQAHYNLANSYFQKGDYENAITSYQNSLMINPEDLDAKYNLELTRKMLKEQMKNQENKQDQNQENKDKEKEKEKQEQQEGDQDQQGDQKDKQEQEGDQEQDQQQGDEEKEADKEKSEAQKQKEAEQKKQEERKKQEAAGKIMSKEDAERILNGIKDAEEDQQKKLKRKMINQSEYYGNDW